MFRRARSARFYSHTPESWEALKGLTGSEEPRHTKPPSPERSGRLVCGEVHGSIRGWVSRFLRALHLTGTVRS
jgi:hypothetical protein